MERILVIRLTAMGDVVLTLPAVNTLRENFPAAKITFLTTLENAALLQGFLCVDEMITLNRAAFRDGNPLRMGGELARLLRRLRAGRFSLAVDLHGNGESAWLTRLSGAPQHWRLAHRAGHGWAYTRQVPPGLRVHPAAAHLHLLEQCGLKLGAIFNDFALPDTALVEARAWFAAQRLEADKPSLYLQPFTSEARKNWPFENYLALANHWHARGVQIIFSGGPADKPLLDQARSLGFAVPVGLSRLADAGLMKLSRLIVGGDTGFLHLAVALGKRVLMLINSQGPTSAVPFQHPEWVMVPPAGAPLAAITPERLVEATGEALAPAGPGN